MKTHVSFPDRKYRTSVMTEFTTLFSILPLLFVSTVGSDIQYPLSIVITGGIISSTLTLLVLSAGYYLLSCQVLLGNLKIEPN